MVIGCNGDDADLFEVSGDITMTLNTPIDLEKRKRESICAAIVHTAYNICGGLCGENATDKLMV